MHNLQDNFHKLTLSEGRGKKRIRELEDCLKMKEDELNGVTNNFRSEYDNELRKIEQERDEALSSKNDTEKELLMMIKRKSETKTITKVVNVDNDDEIAALKEEIDRLKIELSASFSKLTDKCAELHEWRSKYDDTTMAYVSERSIEASEP